MRVRVPASSLMSVIFGTIFLDLVGFGMIIPLVSLYGRNTGATALELGILGASYSAAQFFFAPVWGALSDRVGRRPILLISLFGSSAAYFLFSVSHTIEHLIAARLFAGFCAANISTAQAYISDITTDQNRAKGMGMIGAAFGLGFTLGPPLGGIAAHYGGLAMPGIVAGTLCGLNAIIACFRLNESLPPERRASKSAWTHPLSSFLKLKGQVELKRYLLTFFGVTLAFSMMEQAFSLLLQSKFQWSVAQTGLKTGMVLMWSGLVGALLQGGGTRRLVANHGEAKLVMIGLCLNALGMLVFPMSWTYASAFLLVLPLTLGSSLINPSIQSLISKSAQPQQRGELMGVSQSLGSLARAIGPLTGLTLFHWHPHLPFWCAAVVTLMVFLKTKTAFTRSGGGG